MSLNVLIIPEDPRNDSHILKPIIRALLAYVGKPHANIHFPIMKVGGVDHATSWSFIKKVVGQYRQADLFLLCVDRDNVVGRKQALTNIEQQSAQILPPGRALFAENAWQEIEVWLLAGHNLPNDWSWKDIRAETSAKEFYYQPFAQGHGVWETGIARGRRQLAVEAARNYRRIRQLCTEIADLESRISDWLESIKNIV